MWKFLKCSSAAADRNLAAFSAPMPLAPASPPETEQNVVSEDMKSLLEAWSYDVWAHESEVIQQHIFAMYELLGVKATFCIDTSKLKHCIARVAAGKEDNVTQ